MIKIIIVGVACFVLALAGSTGVVVMTAPKHVAAADSTAVADSTLHAGGEHGATAAHDAAGAEPNAHEPAAEPNPMQLAESVPHTGEPVPHAAAEPAKPDEPADFARVGKILVNMKPAEAAAILSHLSDTQVEGVLRSLGPRQAATMLASMPAERAAQLSKRLLVAPPAEDKKR